MKRALISFVALFLVLTSFAGRDALTAQEVEPQQPEDHSEDVVCGGLQGPNLLDNPSFEGDYHPYVPPGGHQDCPTGICNSVYMADGWTPYWLSPHDTENPDIHNPEYKAAESWWTPPRTHDGQKAQVVFTTYSSHEAGFYQQVSVTPGALYCFGIWGHAWSAERDDPRLNDSELEQNIGIDLTGGTDWQSEDMIWGGPKQYYYDEPGEENAFGPFSLVVRAQTPQMTVFTWSRPIWPVKHNDVYWDDAVVLRVPVEPQMGLSREHIVVLEQPATGGTHTLAVDVNFSQDPGLTWRASVVGGATLDVTLSPAVEDGAAGTGNDELLVSFDSSAYGPGVYEASITVSAEPAVTGSPATIDIRLHLVEEIYRTYAPFAGR